jgi:beta-glucosidase
VKRLSKFRAFAVPVFALAIITTLAGQTATETAPYKNSALPVEQRVADLLGRMTLDEKASMLAGENWMQTVPIPRLGIPSIKMSDGPLGVRQWGGPSEDTVRRPELKDFTSTAFPSGIAIAATWDVGVARSVGQAIAQESKAAGRDMILAPTVNIQRTPLWGRNFEGYGEDPYLTSMMAVNYIKGVQGEGIIATVKHFAANNQEFERHRIDEAIDERTLNEIYFPAFKAAVQQAGVWSVMSAYNKVNGTWCAENPYLLKDVLQKEWGFKGFVVSDWGSTYSTAATVNAGMSLEMPGGDEARKWLKGDEQIRVGNGGDWLAKDKVLAEVKAGHIPVTNIDDNVARILRIMFVSGIFDHPHTGDGQLDTPEQQAVARKASTESVILLKNTGDVLPLDAAKLKTVAVIGPNAMVARKGGGGSSRIDAKYTVTPLAGIKEKANGRFQVISAQGAPDPDTAQDAQTPESRKQLLDEAVAAASKADVALVLIGDSPKVESEDFDRTTLDLPAGQDDLVQAVMKANRKTVVVFNSGAPVNVSKWVNDVPGLVAALFGGQETGHAVADVLFGDANPSGKLPFTFINDVKESPTFGNYPGENLHVKYAEGIYVGYRYFDKKNITPQYPFGYGLSYTKFDYSGLKITPAKVSANTPVQVSLTVRNSGKRAGAEVVQLYVHDANASVDRPVKELKGFQRVELKPGEAKTVTFALDRGAMSFYSTAKKAWVAEPGQFEVSVGASSRDIRQKGTFTLTE